MELGGRRILITGVAQGLGAALATCLSEAGATVIGADVDDASASRLMARLGWPHAAVPLDVSNAEAWRGLAGALAKDGLDAIVLNAGVMTRPRGAPILDDFNAWLDETGYRKVTRVNLDGCVLGVIACLPLLRARGGDILVISSAAGLSPLPLDPFYSMSKHALVGFVRSLAPNLVRDNIRINALCPGGVDTGMAPDDLRAQRPNWAPPSYIAEVAARILTSGETGQVWSAHHPAAGGVWRNPAPDFVESARIE